jgi:hypothetical protein
VPRSRVVGLYLHSPICLHGIVLHNIIKYRDTFYLLKKIILKCKKHSLEDSVPRAGQSYITHYKRYAYDCLFEVRNGDKIYVMKHKILSTVSQLYKSRVQDEGVS